MKIAFITGLSNWNNNVLSPIQTKFLQQLKTHEGNKIYLNFPYVDNQQTYKEPHIIMASLSNAYQYILSKTKWITKQKEKLSQMVAQEDKLLLLSGSCGLELLRNMNFTKEEKEKIHIIAYGGVAARIPDFKYLTLVQGKKDWIAKIWIRDYDLKVESNHMNYLESETLLNFVNEYIEKLEK